jgi:bifunctional UDP-N-acetylglucosamine pyrophosphorylase/glucosamine-1-phosphate N-acetyltransferase
LIKRDFVEKHIDELWMHTNKQEYYINDLIEIASREGHEINIVTVPYEMVHGVNTKTEFAFAESLMKKTK